MIEGEPTRSTVKKAQSTGKKRTGANDLAGKVQAIDRTQAVIEFNLDGAVITANENFLKTLRKGHLS